MPVYLDYNATAPLRPEVIALMAEVLSVPANPSSVHGFGRAAKKYLEDARGIVANAISAWPDEVIFTGSSTEANNMALGLPGRRVLVAATEHSSVLKLGAETIAVDEDGIIKLDELEKLLAGGPATVSVMLANNETGVIQPIGNIAALCKAHGAIFHCDAVQGLGKIPVDFGQLGADMLTLSTHKCGGPVGAGALVARRGLPVPALLKGGGQESNRRAGTENVAAIAGFGKAVQLIDLGKMHELRQWLDEMEHAMRANAGVQIFGERAARLPNTTCVAMPGVSNEVQLMNFDLAGFAVSAGSACSSGRIEPSHVLLAMGAAKEVAGSAIRVSGGWNTSRQDISRFTECWQQTHGRLAKKA